MGIVEEVDFKIVFVEQGDEIGSGELYIFDVVLEGEGGDEKRLIFFLLDGGVAVKYDLFKSQHEHYLLLIASKVLLMLSFTLKMGLEMFKDQ